ncbi:MAG: alpha/beta fold hydrolase [Cyclobacteriaceae bacterium]
MNIIIFIIALLVSGTCHAQNFTEEEVSIGELKGTLSIPPTKTKTAILMISGSGPTDRDGNSAMGLNSNSLKMVAHDLTLEGYPVLRFDKRGIAASKKAVTDPAVLRFPELIEDAQAWLNFLKERGYKKLVIAGHSQGSLVGMVAAQNNKNVKGYISLAGLADDAGTMVVEQLGKQAPILVPEAKTILDSMRAGYTVTKVNPFLASLFGPHIQGYFKSYIDYSPKEEISRLTIPVLIINGTTDIQVGTDQAEMLKTACPTAKLTIIDGMNHLLKDAPSDPAANMATYNKPDLPLSEALMPAIKSFIKTL